MKISESCTFNKPCAEDRTEISSSSSPCGSLHLAGNSVEKLVLDSRQNSGGNSLFLEPLMIRIMLHWRFNREGKLFVMIGRENSSSAILNAISMQERTRAIFVREPKSGSPKH